MSQKGLLEGYDRYVLVVALHGQAYSGKDESRLLLEALAKQAGSHVIEMRYAEPLYKLAQALVPEAHPLMPKEAKERPRKELGGMSVRQLLVTAGEGSRRFVDDAWVKIHSDQLMRRVTEALEEGITDCCIGRYCRNHKIKPCKPLFAGDPFALLRDNSVSFRVTLQRQGQCQGAELILTQADCG